MDAHLLSFQFVNVYFSGDDSMYKTELVILRSSACIGKQCVAIETTDLANWLDVSIPIKAIYPLASYIYIVHLYVYIAESCFII